MLEIVQMMTNKKAAFIRLLSYEYQLFISSSIAPTS